MNFEFESVKAILFDRFDQKSSIVHVFFGRDGVYPRIRKEFFGTTDLIG